MEQVQFLNIARPGLLRRQVVFSLSFLAWSISALNTATTYLFFQDEPKNGTAFSILTSCTMLLLATLACLIFGSPIKVAWPKPAKFSFAYFAFAGLSLFWTEASSLSSAAGYWLGLAADLLFVLILFACEDEEAVAISAVKGFVLGTVAVALIAWTAPGTPDPDSSRTRPLKTANCAIAGVQRKSQKRIRKSLERIKVVTQIESREP